ncbi:MAG TPA: HAMP domain-containing sensor histidine kinase [Candidatus Limnocylindrales bacterium]|nr:HAMP domain-containing sensor histidine kinase [Candidatus Limnocylindrales bacterium]
MTEPAIPGLTEPEPPRPADRPVLGRLSFRTRLTLALVAAGVLPVAGFGLAVLLAQPPTEDQTVARLLIFAIVVAVVLALLLALLLAADLTAPLRAIAGAVERSSAGGTGPALQVTGDDELARLASLQTRLVEDLERRSREVRGILAALETMTPEQGPQRLASRAGEEAKRAFALIDATALLVDPIQIPAEEVIPGVSRPVRAVLRAGDEAIGVLVGRLPATRRWEAADQDLLDLYASEVAVAIRNAELFARVESQNARLVALDEAKDDFLRGIGHNLQTPLARIRAYAGQLDEERPDRRLEVIGEQAERLSRMVRQLLTVSRLESGALRPRLEVLNLATRARRAWEALGMAEVEFTLDDRSEGWLAIGDPDHLDQVLWALLDNAVKYGGGPVEATVVADPDDGWLRLTIQDGGPGVPPEARERLFERYDRGGRQGADGSGLGLYVSRELCRAMRGDLVLEDPRPGLGAAFSVLLPAEPAEET